MLFSRLSQRKLLGSIAVGIVLLSVVAFVIAVDIDLPTWQNQGQSASTLMVGGSNLLYAQGKDETGLRKAVLSTNETGTWINYTSDVGNWVNTEDWIFVDRFDRPDNGSIGNAEYPQIAWGKSGGTISISSNSLKIVGGGPGTAMANQLYSASGTYTMEANISFAQISDWPAIALDYGGVSSNRLGFSAKSDGYIYYLSSPGWVKASNTYSVNVWYDCKITVYPSTHKADYYFDGTLQAANVSYYFATTDPNFLRISQYNSAATFYVDEIFIYEGQTKPAQYPSHSTYGSPMDLGDVADTWVWSNFTWQNPSTVGGTSVSWRIHYEDASGNVNATDIMTFSVISDTSPPQWRNQGESKSTLYQGESVGLYAQGYDDRGLYRAVLSTNETGYWVNYTGSPYEVISGLSWTDYVGNPILPLGAAGEWDSAETGGPDVIMVNDTYYMYYAGHNGSAWSMGLAFSDDGISWTKYENNPILTGTPGEWDEGTLWVPNVIRFNATHFLWVYGATSAGIGVAWSTDGIHWAKYANNPVITPTPGWYDSAEAEGGHTILVDGTLYLYIIGYASDGTGARGGLATSTDGIHWTKIPGNFTYNSILDIGPPGSVDDVEVEPEEPLYSDGVWYLCYSYRSTSASWKCGLAISSDGVNFVKDPNNPLKGQGWTGGWAKRTHINIKSKDGSTRYMYYNSNGQTGMAMAPVTMSSRQTYGSPMDLGNVSGSWVWSNFTWQNASTPLGTTVAWKIYYEDTSGNWNGTNMMTFKVTSDTTPPQWRNQGETKSVIEEGESVGLYAQGYDDRGLYRAVLSTNETGYWVNYTGTPYEVISGLNWTDYVGNPILPLGAAGEWDSAETGGPDVIMVNGTYYMYYAGHNGSAWSMGLAFSDDGISWTKYANNPVLTGTPGQWDSGSLWVPNVIRFNATHFIFVYGGGGRIGVAWSTDGIHWSKYANNPVITPTPGWYDSAVAEGGHTILVNGTLYLYIIGYASDGTGARGGLATSTDGVHWTNVAGPFTYNSILDIGPLGSVDDVEVEVEEPLISDGVWYLCYSYRSTSAYWKCGLAIRIVIGLS